MFTFVSNSLNVNPLTWHDIHLFWRLILKVAPSSSASGRWFSQLYFPLYHPIYCGRVPAGIQNIQSNILHCHIVTGWAAPAINCHQLQDKIHNVIPLNIQWLSSACHFSKLQRQKHFYLCWFRQTEFVSLSVCVMCNDNEFWCNLPIPDIIWTPLTWLITTVVSASLHHGSLSPHDTLVLKSMNVFSFMIVWSKQKGF